jgi:hypothetical protein
VPQRLGAGIAILDLGRERLHHDGLELERVGRIERAGLRELALDDAIHRLEVVLGAERATLGGQLVQHDAEREHVGAAIDDLAPALLGGHVRELALDGPRLGLERAVVGLGDAEVEQLHRAVPRQHDVRRRHVAMHDLQHLAGGALALVSVVQPGRHRRRDVDAHRQRDALAGGHRALEQRAHGVAVDVLHRQEVRVVLEADLEHPGDVRVVQRRRHPRLVEEHLDELLVVAAVAGDDLDHHLLAAPRPRWRRGVARQVDLGHAAAGEVPDDLVPAQALDRGCLGGPHRR